MEVGVTHWEVGQIKPRWLEERAEVDIIVPPEARVVHPTSVLHLQGALDGSSYMTLFEAAQAEMGDGIKYVIVDMAGVPSVSSAGAIGLYMVGAMLEGENVTALEGYAVMAQMRAAIEEGQSLARLSVAAASEPVARALDGIGFQRICPLFPTVDDAISDLPDE